MYISSVINNDAPTPILCCTSDAFCPEVITGSVIFGKKDVSATNGCKISDACSEVKVGCATEISSQIYIACAVNSDAFALVL